MKSRAFALALAIALPPVITVSAGAPLDGPRPAAASVSILLSLDELVAASSYVVVATAGEHRAAWEDLPSGRRIVTYTKLTVERAVAGAPGSEVWVRTLGGVVDKIGQAVSGEARIETGSRSLLFLAKGDGVIVVTALAQGHFPVVIAEEKATPPRLRASPDAGTLLPRRGPAMSAREALVGATLDEAVTAVKRASGAIHAPK